MGGSLLDSARFHGRVAACLTERGAGYGTKGLSSSPTLEPWSLLVVRPPWSCACAAGSLGFRL